MSKVEFHIGGILCPVLETFLNMFRNPWSIFILFHCHVNPEAFQLNWDEVLVDLGVKSDVHWPDTLSLVESLSLIVLWPSHLQCSILYIVSQQVVLIF